MDGIIIINKPKNCTSHDIVYKVKKIFKEKVGHTGTLDPMATGVLPIIDVQERNIEIYSIKLIKIFEEENKISFEVKCSKGTYIRSLCEDIAERLGCIGYMSELNRTKVGDFSIEDAIDISRVENIEEQIQRFSNDNFISLEKLFENKQEILLNVKAVNLILNGVKITRSLSDDIYRLYKMEKDVKIFIGIGIVKENLLKRDIIVI